MVLQCPVQLSPGKKVGYPSDRGIYPVGTGIKLDLCFCIIPTVGFYRKLGEVTATHKQNIKNELPPPRLYCCPPPPLSSPIVWQRQRSRGAAQCSGVGGSCQRQQRLRQRIGSAGQSQPQLQRWQCWLRQRSVSVIGGCGRVLAAAAQRQRTAAVAAAAEAAAARCSCGSAAAGLAAALAQAAAAQRRWCWRWQRQRNHGAAQCSGVGGSCSGSRSRSCSGLL